MHEICFIPSQKCSSVKIRCNCSKDREQFTNAFPSRSTASQKEFAPDLTQPNDPIHIPGFLWFPFPPTQTAEISIFSSATSFTDWALFFLFPVLQWPLVRCPAGTKWHRQERFRVEQSRLRWPWHSQRQTVNLRHFIDLFGDSKLFSMCYHHRATTLTLYFARVLLHTHKKFLTYDLIIHPPKIAVC